MLALTFSNKNDFDLIMEDYTFELKDIINFSFGNSLLLAVRHTDGSVDKTNCNYTYNDNQIEWFKNGSALNLIRS